MWSLPEAGLRYERDLFTLELETLSDSLINYWLLAWNRTSANLAGAQNHSPIPLTSPPCGIPWTTFHAPPGDASPGYPVRVQRIAVSLNL